MICPNCGRELPDAARICPGCSAVQHVSRRRHVDVDLPETQQARVERRVQPEEDVVRHRRVQHADNRQETVTSTEKPQRKNIVKHDVSGDSHVPVGLYKQAAREQAQVRHVGMRLIICAGR